MRLLNQLHAAAEPDEVTLAVSVRLNASLGKSRGVENGLSLIIPAVINSMLNGK